VGDVVRLEVAAHPPSGLGRGFEERGAQEVVAVAAFERVEDRLRLAGLAGDRGLPDLAPARDRGPDQRDRARVQASRAASARRRNPATASSRRRRTAASTVAGSPDGRVAASR
jgi:hypothetical protein